MFSDYLGDSLIGVSGAYVVCGRASFLICHLFFFFFWRTYISCLLFVEAGHTIIHASCLTSCFIWCFDCRLWNLGYIDFAVSRGGLQRAACRYKCILPPFLRDA